MKMKILFFLVGLSSIHFLYAQRNNSGDQYYSYTTRNFRSNKNLNKKIDPENLDCRLLNATVFFCTNEQRVKHKKPELKHVPELEKAAFLHSSKMGQLNFFSHDNEFDVNLRGPDERVKNCGVVNPKVAENIAFYSTSDPSGMTYIELADKLISMWKSSKPHWENILSDESLQLGCGVYFVYEGDNGVFYGTQNFQFFDNVIVK